MFYIATAYGFVCLHGELFTNNIRLAKPYSSFEEADEVAKQVVFELSSKYYAVVKPA
jgi:hypothetical protein